ncbi:hypothetical protein MGG_05185 [Pyricularia oryzae 70-15]|uniref:Uncharacterized protein n=1 Tax=Pyricularia oryzae (strain 70-15 / ATCC MYA-4617 / FGSC 8958) TaxID=242507 RepID=G4N509_PYRO7|nr:uncharacterized protein MGG_05185 [Pyricularia oryzae 70-15]EHA52920.1 hypothetical protein MGG_05185 [Pyricularia oryzae 70-15]KAI7927703.1 hypothetical protein M0657_003105 [Pyricularia oryzae]KAI7930585.1 hypothetical protein M9X92_000649 [Pyricularia oryzae]
MAPVAVEPQHLYVPLVATISHATLAVALTAIVGRGLYFSYKSLSPTQSTRPRLANRERLVPVFSALAALSLALAARSTSQYASISYSKWADERGIDSGGWLPYLTGGNLRRWLYDTPVYRDALEIVAEKARRFWWAQQADLGLVSWALLLSIEGHRRRIPHLWAYLALSQLVNLSYAQNLFYVALLLTPVPLADEGNRGDQGDSVFTRALRQIFPPKPANWCPHPGLFLSILFLNLGAVSLLPFVAETSATTDGIISLAVTTLATRAFSFTLVAMPAAIPVSWGTVHAHPHDAYGAYSQIFRTASLASLVLHGKASLTALVYNTPGSHVHRHIRIQGVIPSSLAWEDKRRTEWERTATAVTKVLGSTSDHPVVAAVGNDVLLSALSLGIWAAARALEPKHILRSCWPFYSPGTAARSMAEDISSLAEDYADGVEVGPADEATVKSELDHQDMPISPRKRGRPPKNAAIASVPSCDEAPPTIRRRGRPRKVKQEEPEPEPEPEQIADPTYEPTPQQAAQVVEGDSLPDEDLDWEVAALAWGITALGGLGCGSAGVYGGECISR